jgi:CHASE2 domain-containing sensor protein
VLADGLQKISDLQARAVMFNVMLSDPDKNNADADAAMDITAQLIRPIAFPLIRLAPQNDKESKLKVVQIPGVQTQSAQGEEATLAAIIPMFGSMHDRLGVANQKPDADGIVRKYPLRWQESGYTLPTLVGRTLEVSDHPFEALPDTFSLNWRNKRGKYARLSFGDLLQGNLNDAEKEQLKDAYIVLSASAPGIGQTKATGVSALEDDGEILATALDDALNNTYLRTIPNWLVLIINLCIIWGLVWVTTRNSVSVTANKLFVIVQSALGGVTLVSASYTNYLIDLSDSMSFGIALFGVIKLVQSLDDRWSRAKPGFRKIGRKHGAEQLLVLGWMDGKVTHLDAQRLQRDIEAVVSMSQVARVDDLFAGESFVKSLCSKYKCLLVHFRPDQLAGIEAVLNSPAFAPVLRKSHDLQAEWDTENKQFVAEVAPLILDLGADLLHQAWQASVQT